MRRFIPDPAQPARPGDSRSADVSTHLAFWLGRVTAGETRLAGAIELTPLLHPGPHGETFVLLHEALASGALEIVEQEGGGQVNSVLAHNRGDRPILALEGESIVGAKQNRVVTLDVAVGAGESVAIPVGCVERGRWHHVSAKFASADLPVEPAMRRSTSSEMRRHGHVNQARLWSDVDMKLAKHRIVSKSADYHEYVRRRKAEADRYLVDFRVEPNQVGVIARLDGQLLGLDVLGSPANWASLAERLVTTYVLAGLDAPAPVHAGGGGADAPEAGASAGAWLERIATAGVRTRPGLGRGVQIALEGAGFGGGGLWWAEGLAHLAVFGE